MFYSRSAQWTFNADSVRRPFVAAYTPARGVHGSNRGADSTEKRRTHERGTVPPDWWADGFLSNVSAWRKERTGWPTQKPLALLDRIVKAGSNPGDMVLDPFCGCATTCVAAERLGRRWAGIDIDSKALEVTLARLRQQVDERNESTKKDRVGTGKLPGLVFDATAQRWEMPEVHGLQKPPRRTDPHRPKRTRNSVLRAMLWGGLPKSDDGRGACPGCGRGKCADDFDLDHIVPKSKGGADADDNIQLLCHSCNAVKSDGTMADLHDRLRERTPGSA